MRERVRLLSGGAVWGIGLLFAVGVAATSQLEAGDKVVAEWPAWRGPTANGISTDTRAPTRWSQTENVVWKADVPGTGHSSPIVCGDRVILSTADETANTQSMVAFDRNSGKLLWNTLIHKGGQVHRHQKNTQASSTPACDGERVYITFLNGDAVWLTALDLDGHIVWQKPAGKYTTFHGYGSSPALYKSLVIVVGESKAANFIAAFEGKDGKEVWRVEREALDSFSSPLVAQVAGRDQVLLCGAIVTASFDPATGQALWKCQGPTEIIAGTVTYEGDLVFASGGYPGAATLCVRADGTGDVTGTHLVWQFPKKFYVPTPLVKDGLMYGVADDGVAYCYETAKGKLVWQQRLGGAFSSSVTLAGDLLYVPDEAGKTYVFKTGRKFELVATNDLADGGFASPTICGGRIFLRTNHQLYCIGDAGQSP